MMEQKYDLDTKFNFYIHGIKAKTERIWDGAISVQLQGNQEPIFISLIRVEI
ncbi:hypothetical protein Syn7502_01508 [Synechococcus sp. PCC 7502]|uniref:hypothetical protein n=1 Tax=Synechococcus sp. PCC 7502 TaxID=1173263 RepID=UPI00029F8303|nr:hypothetical protein [Synechococcus sp. PCC 7502]AFY73576.1 hypothetical protein Syn7502_01508 [Synechococcus sp. PCC 7502]